jgi:hypothetical protein
MRVEDGLHGGGVINVVWVVRGVLDGHDVSFVQVLWRIFMRLF